MAINLKKPHVDEAAQLHTIAAGTRKFLGTYNGINVSGKSYTSGKDVATQLDAFGTQVGNYQVAALNLKTQLAELKKAQPEIRATVAAVHGLASGKLGAGSAEMSQMGFTPTKVPGPKTGQQMVDAATKRAQARQILGTKGKKQKKAALAAARAVTPPTTGSAPAPAAAPSAASVPAAAPVPASTGLSEGVNSTAAEPAAATAASPIPGAGK